MRIHNKLDEILKSVSKIKILRFLSGGKDEYTGRAIAKGINMSASSTYETLQKMFGEGLVGARRKGKAVLYRLKGDNYIVKKLLEPFFAKEKSIYDDMMSLIKRRLFAYKSRIVSIAVFGSVARREETSKSDIDLLIVVKDRFVKNGIDRMMDDLNTTVAKEFGAVIFPYILTKREIKRKYAKKLSIIYSILRNNQLIYGEPIERILA